MKESSQAERRREERYPQNLEVVIQQLPGSEAVTTPPAPAHVAGRIQNISRNGICLATPSPIRLLSVIRCEIPVSDSDIPIATLMRVRWTRKYERIDSGFLSGLEAIL